MCVFQKLQFNVLTDDSPVEDVDFGAYVVQRIFGGVRLDNDGSVIGIVSTVAKLAELVNRDFVPVVTNYTVVAFLVLVGSSCVVLNRNEVEVGTLVVPDEGVSPWKAVRRAARSLSAPSSFTNVTLPSFSVFL